MKDFGGKHKMKQLNLPIDTLNMLHQWLPFEAGVLFPFKLEDTSANGRIEAMLTKAGFLSAEGKLSAEAHEIFSIIAEANNTSKIRFLVEGDLLDYQVFFSKDSSKTVSLKRGTNGFTVASPSPSKEIVDLITSFSGMGPFGTVPAKWVLNNPESIVLGAIIDAIRRNIMSSLAKDEESFMADIPLERIQEICLKADLNANWLIWAIKSFVYEDIDCSEDLVREAILSLEEKKLVKLEDSNVIPCQSVVFTARKLLHLNCLYLVDSFSVKTEEGAQKSRFSVIQNGIRELLLLDTNGENIAWQGISGEVLITLLLKNLVGTAPDEEVRQESTSQKKPATKPAAKTTRSSPSKCPACGKDLKKNAKFCSKCGETI